MRNRHLYRAKDVLTKQWVYGNYIDKVNGCVPLIVTDAWMQDNGGVDFNYHFVDSDTLEIVGRSQLRYVRERTYFCPPDCGGEEFDEWGEVPYCPNCNNKFGDLERPNFCPKCGLPLDWSR